MQPSTAPSPILADHPRRDVAGMLAVGVLPLAALLVLFIFNVPLGQPNFPLRYSPLWPLRLERTAVGWLIGIVGVVAFVCANQERVSHARARLLKTAAAMSYVAMMVWSFFAPPNFVEQHAFNLLSPSHEGAFVLEARSVSSIREYVSSKFYERLAQRPEDMRGRRVLSNPPGMTVLCVAAHRVVDGAPALRAWLVKAFGLSEVEDRRDQTEFAAALLLAIFMTAIWGLSFWPAYRLCRLWLHPLAAAAIAFSCVFNPATLNYTPGKDPMQLFTTLAIAYFWLAGYFRKSQTHALFAGVATVVGLSIGLIHAWILIIVVVATFIHSMRSRGELRTWTRSALWCLLGFAFTSAVFYCGLDWNIVRTTYHVAVRYGQIQLPIITDPFFWTLLGLPLFMLFAGPCLWVELFPMRGSMNDECWRFGRILALCTGGVMTYSYFFANNSETVRLWIPFIPLLLVGLALRRPTIRSDGEQSAKLLALVAVLQLTVTWGIWVLMDVRESEWRLMTGRLWN